MDSYLVERPNKDYVLVSIMKHKDGSGFSFINFTKNHICPCKFETVDDAIADLEKGIREGKIIKYTRIPMYTIK
jgi:hypothetical protein